MLKLHVTFKFTSTLLLVLALSSCVGTIDETPTVQPSVEGSKEKVDFAGVNACKAIGHDKIDVYFGQASVNGSSDQSNIVYQVFQDGNFDEAVATAIGNQIPTDENGLFHLMVSGIPKNTEASFVVRAFDSVSGTSDDNYITCLEKTLSTGFKRVIPPEPYTIIYPPNLPIVYISPAHSRGISPAILVLS